MSGFFSLKTKVLFGNEALNNIAFHEHKHVFIATDKIMRQVGACEYVTSILDSQHIPYEIFDEIEPNPSLATVKKGVERLMRSESSIIVSIGGGSVIDAAKAFVYFMLKAKTHLSQAFEKPLFVAIPTTSGAGSEVTAYSVVTDTENFVKIPLVSDDIIPDIAVLDPRFTITCPPKVTAESGFDVLTHVLESYVSVNSNPFTEALVEKVVPMVFQSLREVYQNGKNLEARLTMHEASCLAGIAFTNSGLGLNHAMAHSLGGRFPISHGRANALLMPHVIAFNSRVSAEKYSFLAQRLNFSTETTLESCIALITAVATLSKSVDLPSSVLDFGITQEEYENAIPDMAKVAMNDPCLATNPISPSLKEIEQIYYKIL
ncbi:MAG: 1-propanol dehydrogenase PduQ [Brevinema sp.]